LSDLTVQQEEVIVPQTAPLADLLLPQQEIMIPRLNPYGASSWVTSRRQTRR
jgi:hypothetical protein